MTRSEAPPAAVVPAHLADLDRRVSDVPTVGSGKVATKPGVRAPPAGRALADTHESYRRR